MNALRIPSAERDRLVERLQGVRMPPIDIAAVRGLVHGNDDLVCEWTPTVVSTGTTPLPGHEHDTEFER